MKMKWINSLRTGKGRGKFLSRIDQAEERMSELEDKVEELDHISK